MDLQLPPPIETYVRAENSGDVEAMAECFAPGATVRDEGHYYEGLPAIRNWKSRAKRKYNQTVTPLEISTSNGNATLKAQLSGRFPGSPVTANFHFTLVDDQIASLQIRS
jgi:SnoaL-like domain